MNDFIVHETKFKCLFKIEHSRMYRGVLSGVVFYILMAKFAKKRRFHIWRPLSNGEGLLYVGIAFNLIGLENAINYEMESINDKQ